MGSTPSTEFSRLAKLITVEDPLIRNILSLKIYDYCYLVALYRKFTGKPESLSIDENFYPSALLTHELLVELRSKWPHIFTEKSTRGYLVGSHDYYTELVRPEYLKAALGVILWCNPMDGGLGSSVKRDTYLQALWALIFRTGAVRLGAKGTDLYFKVKLPGWDKRHNPVEVEELVSITELKYLQILQTPSQYHKVIIQELVNHESIMKTLTTIREYITSIFYYHYGRKMNWWISW